MATPPFQYALNAGTLFKDLEPAQKDALTPLLNVINYTSGELNRILGGRLDLVQNAPFEFLTLTRKCPAKTWTAPTFENAWVNYDATTWDTAGYRIDPDGRAHLKGLVKSGTDPGTIFTLPSGYRPALNQMFSVVSADVFARVDVNSDGTVKVAVGGNNAWVSLNGIAFDATDPAPAPAYQTDGWPIYIQATNFDGGINWVQLVQARDTSAQTTDSVGANAVDWVKQPNGGVSVRTIHGLTPGRTYDLTFMLYGGKV